jgi:toxin-antitoxin system PIN domain toxin
MVLTDVNVLLYAFRKDMPEHAAHRDWLEELLNADESFGMSELVLSGVIRIVTNPRIFSTPAAIEDALAFAEQIRGQSNCVTIAPGARHWDIFTRLCSTCGVRGSLVPDAYFAALAIESGCEWITADRGYSRFPGLRWRAPV